MACYSDNDVEEPSKQGAKKKKNKKKTKENNTSENQAQTDVSKSDSSKEETSQTRTFGNGLIIQTVALGQPDGKKAAPGKKVNNFEVASREFFFELPYLMHLLSTTFSCLMWSVSG
jgi:FK506-binding nuclear protein